MENVEKMSVRKKIAVWCLILIVKIVEPTAYSHEWSKELDEMKKLIGEL